MRNFIFCLMTLACVACELDIDVNNRDVQLSGITIECIDETTISNNTSGDTPFTKHTYLCRGVISSYRGECYIRVLHDNFIVHNHHDLIVSGGKLPFEFTFAPEWKYLDAENLTFIIEVIGEEGNTLCRTTAVATQHPTTTPIE